MYAAEMADVSLPVQFLCDNCEARGLLEVKTSWRDQIASSEEVCQLRTNVEVDFR